MNVVLMIRENALKQAKELTDQREELLAKLAEINLELATVEALLMLVEHHDALNIEGIYSKVATNIGKEKV